MFDSLVRFVRDQYGTNDFIPLHARYFPAMSRST